MTKILLNQFEIADGLKWYTGKKFKLLRSEKLYLSSEEKFISLRRKRELRNIDITEVDESRVTLPLYIQY